MHANTTGGKMQGAPPAVWMAGSVSCCQRCSWKCHGPVIFANFVQYQDDNAANVDSNMDAQCICGPPEPERPTIKYICSCRECVHDGMTLLFLSFSELLSYILPEGLQLCCGHCIRLHACQISTSQSPDIQTTKTLAEKPLNTFWSVAVISSACMHAQ